ncbi:hypothetical protein ArsFIN_49920 (plasmid) [Arsenophonus nasoniae]|uniref:Uncharacterized protein n=1 Tax=Arsenophonus nasoniae TaxID=638 RepID=A0A4P7L1I4_9GAMM|nr:hypothetical protein ArsFIN_49920 [Arsenophonus nasoniae]
MHLTQLPYGHLAKETKLSDSSAVIVCFIEFQRKPKLFHSSIMVMNSSAGRLSVITPRCSRIQRVGSVALLQSLIIVTGGG